jgi:DNA-binding MarR family transcriptional regulator
MPRVREEETLGWPELPRRTESAAEGKAREGARALIALWMHATRVRRRAEATLRRHGLSFPLWWVLYVTDELIRETSDAVSQRAVSRQTKLGKATVSYLMGILAERSLVDRGPEFGGTSYRIWLTPEGQSLLEQSSQAIELTARSDDLGLMRPPTPPK